MEHASRFNKAKAVAAVHLTDECSEAMIGPQPLGLVEHGNGDGCSHFAESLGCVVDRCIK